MSVSIRVPLNMLRVFTFSLLTLALLLAGCSSEDPDERANAEMADELQRVYEEMQPQHNPFLSARRVAMMESAEIPSDPVERVPLQGHLAQELLYAGETEKAIAVFEDIERMIEGIPELDDFRNHLHEYMALAWLRLGEQQNCIINHTSASCIIPIADEGVHEIETGSRNAIEYYTRLLERDPEHLNNRWLLNLAHMTLGRYPWGVPEEWKIPEDVFADDYDIGRFHDVAPQLGVDVAELSGGAIVDDFTGNGLLDIMTSSWHLEHQIRLFENNGDGSFTDVTDASGLTGITGGLNMKHADFTNNGLPDVLVLRGAWMDEDGQQPNSLLRNNGDGTFTDVTRQAGLMSYHPTQTAVWADFNNNGWVDLYIGNETTGANLHPAELYLNNGDGTFTDVAEEAGVDAVGFIKGVDAGDFNNNGHPDLYVSRMGGTNLLFRNDGADANGIPTFTEVGLEAGVQEPSESFPTWFWDFNNNGLLDLFVSGYRIHPNDVAAEYLGREVQATMPRLYRNNGDGTFTDVAEEKGLHKVMYTMGSNFGDFDNDGWLDFLIGTGDPDMRALMPNRAFRNDGGERFQEVTHSGGFGNIQKGHAVAFGDLNNNGLQDIYMNLGGALEGDIYQNALYANPGHGNNWITLRLRGTESNRLGIGARLRLVVENEDGSTREIHRVVGSGSSFGGNSLQQEIGLGPAASIARLEIRWPASGLEQVFEDVAANQILELHEGSEELLPIQLPSFAWPTEVAHTSHLDHDPP